MKCPACDAEMVERRFGATIDICENGCRGIWFDREELMVVKESGEELNRELEDVQSRPQGRFREKGTLLCPRCQLPMKIRKSSGEPNAYVDECPGCGGLFVDRGELALVDERRPAIVDVDQRVAEMMIRESNKSRRADARSRDTVDLVCKILGEVPKVLLRL